MTMIAAIRSTMTPPKLRMWKVTRWLKKVAKLLDQLRAAGMHVKNTLASYRVYGHWTSDNQAVTVDQLLKIDRVAAEEHMRKVLDGLKADLDDWRSGFRFKARQVKTWPQDWDTIVASNHGRRRQTPHAQPE